ncbi:hypothetical protein HELRODRAFT_164376 [Helobdella robusta]|uniref:Agrin n=1 Tax=Helobdella robusta TaxID=6412 RepID=T1EVC4_HELRO|nr:hypothetical protein HELRODRAFT_164376 [Helobdella robusta]ESN94520.1 hypothetical protein HELRODRAFT_164376 [Helobdella robusta]
MTLLFVILLLNNVLLSYSIKKNLLSYELSRRQSEECFDLTIEEKVNNAEFIFSGTVREVRYNVDKKAQKASVEIKRIFKGQHKLTQLFLSEIKGRFLPIVHKVCTVEGLGLDGLCSSHTRVFDTWLFFTNPVDDKLQLNSSLVRLSVMSIASIESAVADSDECSDDHFCQYSEKCVRSAEGKFECRCLQECSLVGEAVCGSDGVTYVNECFLNRTMCHAKKHIYVHNFGPCVCNFYFWQAETRDPCATITCYYGSKCAVEENQPSCVCEDDRSCEAYDENEDINDVQSHYHKHEYNSVCGDDGVQYRNICELRKRQCIEQREINVKVYGLCGGRELCGSGGNMVRNECEMRWSACSKQEDVYHVHESYCELEETKKINSTPVSHVTEKTLKTPAFDGETFWGI